MKLAERILKIVADSSSLLERIQGDLFEPDLIQERAIIQQRLNEFRQIAAKNNPEKFAKLLDWYGLDETSLKPWLGEVHLRSDASLPSWVETLTDILNAPKTIDEDLKSSLTDLHNPLPFEDVFLFMVVLAKEKLVKKLHFTQENLTALLSDSAWIPLQRLLLSEICQIGFVTLYKQWQKQTDLPLVYKLTKVVAKAEPKNQIYYQSFVKQLLTDNNLLNLFEEYPVLAKLIAIKIDFWIAANQDFLQRLKQDLPEIQKKFNPSSRDNLTPVVDLKSGISDPHNQGYRVIALTFASGLKLIYKPKNLDIAIAYQRLLEWINHQDTSLKLKTLNILNRSDYGWIEYIESMPCENPSAVSRFYHRAGMLLCISYILNSTDCLQENFIASGEDLVLIDLETVIYNNRGTIKNKYNQISLNQDFSDSVINTGIIPSWYKYNDLIYYDYSALGTFEPQVLTDKYPFFKSVNTDYLHIAYEKFILGVKNNIPQLKEKSISPQEYLPNILNGFQEVYRIFLDQKEALLPNHNIFTNFLNLQTRFIFRNTNIYAETLQNSLIPQVFKSGIDRSIALNLLSRPMLLSQKKAQDWEVFLAEMQAIEVLDIPYLTGNVSNGDLVTEFGTVIKDYFQETAYNKILQKISYLGEEDLLKQNSLIEASFFTKFFRFTHRQSLIAYAFQDTNTDQHLSQSQLVAEATNIAKEILAAANPNPQNLDWVSLIHIPYTNLLQVHVLKPNLFDGTLGIALFLGALAKVTDSQEFADAAFNTLNIFTRILNNLDLTQQLIQVNDIGATTGLGSMIYSLVKISQFCPEKAKLILTNAQKLAEFITIDLIAKDTTYNLMTGVGGTILGLLALYQETGSQEILEKAITCGKYLLKGRSQIDNKQGFLTGTAGISYALWRLYEVTKDNHYLEAAKEGISYESKLLGNCEQSNWCHGSAGIGLGLLAVVSVMNEEDINHSLHSALEIAINAQMLDVDDLCCGNMGQIEFLIEASERFNPSLLAKAKEKANRVIALAKETGSYRIYPGAPKSLYLPGFFKGTAGIGYQLLRLAYPHLLPSILLWE